MKKALPFFLVSLAVLALDQFTKYLAVRYVLPYEVIPVAPFVNLVYVENIGSAFGMMKSLGNPFFIVVSAAAIVAVSVIMAREPHYRLSLSLVLGGAAGNLIDRVARGYVVDFVDLYAGRFHWPAFNVADSALTVGIILLVAMSLFSSAANRAGTGQRRAG
ncbi:MAG: signal peptidase II [Chloroflexota bacterium]